jgi:lactoylglutathione lyase
MTIDHIAIWTTDLEKIKDYYTKYYGGRANEKYTNSVKQFDSYFISFDSGSRLELMQRPDIPDNLNDRVEKQHLGISHISFGMESMEQVIEKSKELAKNGFRIICGPRKTGDGYFEFKTLDPDNNRIEVSAIYVE